MCNSKMLKRQIRKHLSEISELEKKRLRPFFRSVENAYKEAENDRILMERSLEISSEELLEKNQKLAQESEQQKLILQNLLEAVQTLKKETGQTQPQGILDLTKHLKNLIIENQELDKMKSEFISIASHQLRTPTTAIRWLLEVFFENNETRYKNINEAQRETLQEVQKSNERMICLINDLLDVSRLESGTNFHIRKTKGNILEALAEALNENRILAQQKNIKLKKIKIPKKPLILNIDHQKISQVFHNFINNAIKYSPKNSEIKIICQNKKNEITFEIEDQGIGIPKKEQDRLFQKFFQAQNAHQKTANQGTGLGLYIAKKIVENHGGSIHFKSTTKKGTTFSFTLPKKKV